MVSQQVSRRFLKTTTEGESVIKVVTCSMARRFAQKKQLFDEPDEKSDDAISGHDHEGENKKVE